MPIATRRGLLATTAALPAAPAAAQPRWPTRPIRFVAPSPPADRRRCRLA